MKYRKTNVLQIANAVFKEVQKRKLFKLQDNLFITVSGGQDSVFCLLVLFLLKKRINLLQKQKVCKTEEYLHMLVHNTWNREKLRDFLKEYQVKKPLVKHSLIQISWFHFYCHTTKKQTNKIKQILHEYKLKQKYIANFDTAHFIFDTQHFLRKKRELFEGKEVAYNHLFLSNYTLIWCHHFWQRNTFFTMEHISKVTFPMGYKMYFFAPIKTFLSEESARNWRHKIMQRSSCFFCKKRLFYKAIELHLNSLSITHPRNVKGPNKNQLFFGTRLPKLAPFRHPPKKIDTSICKQEQGFDCNVVFAGQRIKQRRALNTVLRSEHICIQGHTKSDRAESILLNVIKGTGMNGISTLQWKHTFLPVYKSNTPFYPISSDFFKEIRITCLQSFFIDVHKEEEKVTISKISIAIFLALPVVLKQSFFQSRTFNTTLAKTLFLRQYWHNKIVSKKVTELSRLNTTSFLKRNHVKTFYYQLRCQIEKA